MFIFGLLYSIFLFIVFSSNDFRDFAYSMAAIGIAYITIIGIAQSEYKNNSDIIINSLPTTRREIVAAKYLSVVTCTVIALLIVGAVGIPFSLMPAPFDYRLLNGVDIITTIVCVLLLAALSLPIYFWTGAPWIRVVNIVIFLLIFFAPAQIAEFAVNNHQSPTIAAITQLINYQSWQLALGGMAVMLVLMAVSYYISLRIYMTKDF